MEITALTEVTQAETIPVEVTVLMEVIPMEAVRTEAVPAEEAPVEAAPAEAVHPAASISPKQTVRPVRWILRREA